jgi:hypothetical protein
VKIKDFWDKFDIISGKSSDLVRQLAYAGVGVVWVFAVSKGPSTVIPAPLHAALFFIIICLICDLAQYVYASVAWYLFCRYHEEKLRIPAEDPDLDAPNSINVPTWIFFGLKIVFVGVAYFQIIKFMANKIVAA